MQRFATQVPASGWCGRGRGNGNDCGLGSGQSKTWTVTGTTGFRDRFGGSCGLLTDAL